MVGLRTNQGSPIRLQIYIPTHFSPLFWLRVESDLLGGQSIGNGI